MEINLAPFFATAAVIAAVGAAFFVVAEFLLDFWNRLNLAFKVGSLAAIALAATIVLASQL